MLPYRLRALNLTQGRGLQCNRCDIWIGSTNLALGRLDYFFTHCEVCLDILCEHYSHEYIEKPMARINQLMTYDRVSMDTGHWANKLSNASRHGTDQLKNIYDILDINRPGREQWRRRDWNMNSMRKTSRGPRCFVPDAFPYEDWELAREQPRASNHLRDHGGKPNIEWSCSGNHPP